MQEYEILVIGGGPAGLTAALYAARAGKRVAVLERDNPGGQILNSPQVENYPALQRVSGAEFAENLQRQAEAQGVELVYAEAEGAEKDPKGFTVRTDGGDFACRALILAPGVVHRTLGLPGEAELAGAGLSCCAVCDGPFYAGREVAVVGGGDSALQEALFLSGICSHVTLLVRRDRFRGEAALTERVLAKENVEVLFCHTVGGFLTGEDGLLRGLTVLRGGDPKTARTLPVSGVFLAVGQTPATEPFASLTPLDPKGYIITGPEGETEKPGLFAAGDCRSKQTRQLATAVGDGAAAGMAACRWVERNG